MSVVKCGGCGECSGCGRCGVRRTALRCAEMQCIMVCWDVLRCDKVQDVEM